MTTIPNWVRPDFTPGGTAAFVLFGVLGEFDLTVPIDRQAYRSSNVPEGFEFVQYDRHENPAGFTAFFRTNNWALARADEPDLADRALKARHLALIRGFVRDTADLNYLRNTVGLVQYLFDRGGIACYDPQTFQLWTADRWQREVFAPARPMPHAHVVTLRTPTADDTEWLHTRGMRVFARPDLSVHLVGRKYADAVITLFNRYIEYQANGGTILNGDVVTLDGLPADGTCELHDRLDNPDFHNAYVEIVWPNHGLAR